MYYITYKTVLKAGRKYEDFTQWLGQYWTMQRNWGATSVQFWNDNDKNKNIIICRFAVKNLEKWNYQSIQPEAEPAILALSQIVDINQTSLKIGLNPVFENE
ncbi:hypothetical protein JW824_12895 [bacterium]|nr:hypothetical protein [bacterium]RQV93741.1 MAG: hypothetical protein EH221_08685 [bacterium]